MTVIQNALPDQPDSEYRKLLDRLLISKGQKLYRPEVLGDVMIHLQKATDARHFEDLEHKVQAAEIQHFILRRFGASREKAPHFTPECIKALRPQFEGVYLVWQLPAMMFEAYYPRALLLSASKDTGAEAADVAAEEKPAKRQRTKTPPAKPAIKGKKHITCSRQYGAIRTTINALWQVVNFLWNSHAKAKQVPRPSGGMYVCAGVV